MAAYLKSIDSKHLLEIGLEGFYGESRQQYNPNSNLDVTDFIANNQIPNIDVATIHLYPESWLPSTNKTEAEQLAFVDKWIKSHVLNSNAVLEKPIVISEFGKSYKLEGYSLGKRNKYFQKTYDDVYNSARLGGPFVGELFWQLITPGMDNMADGYNVVLEQSPSTASIIAEQSKRLLSLSLY
ncbi:hypothetical protein J1N35_001657 [Gossypium stocksii]|uniref:mannan endo-1,4-beta-mannosidase n=1 Tax=Gossypium stocksii TaxID=47602 RepID=A0A9D4AMH0_9ROSI|nr:hypothetical protein J1N35_001657 [Gossypium stocksii]